MMSTFDFLLLFAVLRPALYITLFACDLAKR